MFVVEARKRTAHVGNFRPLMTFKAKSFKEAENALMGRFKGLFKRSGRVKPGKRIESINFSDRENIYSLKKIG